MPTIQSLAAFLRATHESSDSELEVRRTHEGKCTAKLFEDLLRNAKVYSTFRKKIVFKFSYSSADSVPEVLFDEDEVKLQQDVTPTAQAAEVREQNALRQQYSLHFHVVPANVTDKVPAQHGSVQQKVLAYTPDYNRLSEEGRWLAFDEFLAQ